jgi:hypothetical protein
MRDCEVQCREQRIGIHVGTWCQFAPEFCLAPALVPGQHSLARKRRPPPLRRPPPPRCTMARSNAGKTRTLCAGIAGLMYAAVASAAKFTGNALGRARSLSWSPWSAEPCRVVAENVRNPESPRVVGSYRNL